MATARERKQYEKFQQAELRKVKDEAEGDDVVTNNFEYRYFVSESSGKGRKKRKQRDVELVVDVITKKARVLKDTASNGLDVIAQGLLGDDYNDPYNEFVRRLKRARKA